MRAAAVLLAERRLYSFRNFSAVSTASEGEEEATGGRVYCGCARGRDIEFLREIKRRKKESIYVKSMLRKISDNIRVVTSSTTKSLLIGDKLLPELEKEQILSHAARAVLKRKIRIRNLRT